ncbi:MAG: DUF898 family protein [Minwuia sp.]|nr:DUF898 family protein [Minwuia sp.]
MNDDAKPGWPEPALPSGASSVPDTSATTDAAPAGDGGAREAALTLEFHGTRKQFRRMLGRDVLLMFMTLGIYWFWSRTNVRRFIWSHLSLGGSRLEYAGRGIELFIGFVIAGTLLAITFWGLQFLILSLAGPRFGPVAWLLALYPLFTIFGLLAIYRRHRYMVRRTSWRGIRCGMTGSTGGYIAKVALPLVLTILTLGLAYPLITVATQRYLIGNMSVGSEKFVYQGRARDIFGRWIICWLLIPFSGGLSLSWWKGFTSSYQLRKTSLGSLRFSSMLRPMHVVGIYFLGGLVAGLIVYGLVFLVSTIGFGILSGLTTDDRNGFDQILFSAVPLFLLIPLFGPVSYAAYLYFVDYKFVEYLFETTAIVGTMDVESIAQVHDRHHGPGDGLDAVLGVDGI